MPSQTRRGDNFGLGKFPNGSNGSKWALSNAPNRSFPEGDLPPSPPHPVLTMPISNFLLLRPAENRCL